MLQVFVWAYLTSMMAANWCIENSSKTNLTIGFMFPLFRKKRNGTQNTYERVHPSGFERCVGALLAVDHINNAVSSISTVPPKLSDCIRIHPCVVKNSENLPYVGMERALEYVMQSHNQQLLQECDGNTVDAVVGPSGSSVSSKVSAALGLFHVPSVSYAATASKLSNKVLFPYFLRTVPPDSHQASVMLDIIKTFSWNRVGIFYDKNDIYSDGLYQSILSLFTDGGHKIETVAFECGGGKDATLHGRVKVSGVRIFVSLMPTMETTVDVIRALVPDFFGHPDYAWILSDAASSDGLIRAVRGDSGDTTRNVRGVLGVSPSEGLSSLHNVFVNELWRKTLSWENKTFQKLLDAVPPDAVDSLLTSFNSFEKVPNNKVPFAYDAVLVLAVAALKASTNASYLAGTFKLSEVMMDIIKRRNNGTNIEFSGGLSGKVSIDADGDNVGGSYDIVNYQEDQSGTFVSMVTVARWQLGKNQGFSRDAQGWHNNVTFYGGYIPGDGVTRTLEAPRDSTSTIPPWLISLVICLGGVVVIIVAGAVRWAFIKYAQRTKRERAKMDVWVWIKLYAGNMLLRVLQVSGRLMVATAELFNVNTLTRDDGLYEVAGTYQLFFGLYLLSACIESFVKLNEVRIDCETFWKGISIDANKSIRFRQKQRSGERMSTRSLKITSTGDPDVALKKTNQRLRLAYFYSLNLFIKTIPFMLLKLYLVLADASPDGIKYACSFPSGCSRVDAQSEGAGANVINIILVCLLAASFEKELFELRSIRSIISRKKRLTGLINEMATISEGRSIISRGKRLTGLIKEMATGSEGLLPGAVFTNPLYKANVTNEKSGKSRSAVLPLGFRQMSDKRRKRLQLSVRVEEVLMSD